MKGVGKGTLYTLSNFLDSEGMKISSISKFIHLLGHSEVPFIWPAVFP